MKTDPIITRFAVLVMMAMTFALGYNIAQEQYQPQVTTHESP
ncbi:MAG: hypothetical protein ACO376_07835 [Gammaproteobacteria bacterium]|jgi:hypothetical protein